MALPAACAVAYGGLRLLVLALPYLNGTPGRPAPNARWILAGLALAGLPVVAFLGRVGSAVWQLRWQRFAWCLGGSVVLSVVLAVVWLALDNRLGPTDRYTWEGWPTAWYLGAYATGLLLILWAFLKVIGTVAGRGVRRVFRPGLKNEPNSKIEV